MGEPMNRSNQGKLLVVLAVTAAALWLLSPSYQFYSMTPAQREATAPAKLAEKVIKGGQGVWGPVPMPPNKVTEDEAKKMVATVLAM